MPKNLSMPFKRLRKSPHYREIHNDVVNGVPISSIVKKIQGRWHEMTDVTPRTLERQLARYKEALMLDKSGMQARGVEKALPTLNGEVGWAGRGIEQAENALKEDDTEEDNSSSTSTSGSQGNDNALSIPENGGVPAVPENGGALAEIAPVKEFNSRDHMIHLYGKMVSRIDAEMLNEKKIGKLIPGMAVEMSVAKDMLKCISVMDGEHMEPGGVNNIQVNNIQVNVEEKLAKAGLQGILESEKSRKRILTALRSESTKIAGCKGEVIPAQCIPSGISGEEKNITPDNKSGDKENQGGTS